MSKKGNIVIFIHLLFAVLAAATARSAAGENIQTMAIPAYFSPGSLWTQMEDANPTVGLAVINPNSGPGTTQVTSSQAAGLTVIGYVNTSYGNRPINDVRFDIDAYYNQSFYPTLDGIFLDEVSTDCIDVPYYQDLYEYIKTKGGKGVTVINPGTQTSECYICVSDIIVNFEDEYSQYINYSQPSWVKKYPPSRFWHLVYNTPSIANMREALSISKKHNAGWVYVTPAAGPNWNTLPPGPYWTDELTGVRPPRISVKVFNDSWNVGPVDFTALAEKMATEENIGTVFLSIDMHNLDDLSDPADLAYAAKVRSFVSAMHLKDISVHAIFITYRGVLFSLSPPFYYTGSVPANCTPLSTNYTALERVQDLIAFQNASPAPEKFDGFNIDVEPEATCVWKLDINTRFGLVQSLLDLMGDIDQEMNALPDPLNIPFSASIYAYYMNNAGLQPHFTQMQNGVSVSVGYPTDFLQYCDFLILMSYDDNYGDVIDAVDDEIDYISSQSIPYSNSIMVGLKTKDVGLGNTTFWQEGYYELDRAMKEIREVLESYDPFGGFVIFEYKSYVELKNRADLVAYYPFNGNTDDESGNEFHGAIFGGNPNFVPGILDSAIELDGVDDYVELPNECAFDLDEFTIAATLKVPDHLNENWLISKGTSFGNYTLRIRNGSSANWPGYASYVHQISDLISDGNWSGRVSDSSVPVNEFFNLAVTLNTSEFKAYINGDLIATYPNPAPPRLNNDPVIIGGGGYYSLSEFFKGVIDEIRIYNRPLSASEIWDIHYPETYKAITPIGRAVNVQPQSPKTSEIPVSLTFDHVITGGTTSVTASRTGPTPPPGSKLGNPSIYYDISTTANFTGQVEVCIDYSEISIGDESQLALHHYEDTDGNGITDTWVDRTSFLNTANNVICASVDSLSLFAIFKPSEVEIEARYLKEGAIDALTDYAGESKKIEKAIKEIEKSLDRKLWETDSTLTMKGKKVFKEESKAVKQLMKIVKKKNADRDVKDAALEGIGHLITADQALASTAIEMAIEMAKDAGCSVEGNNDPECKKALKEIAKAGREMDKAQDEISKGKYHKAIDHYKKAWEHAQKAIK